VTFEREGRTAVGALHEGRVYDLTHLPVWRGEPPADIGAMLAAQDLDLILGVAEGALERPEWSHALDEVRLRAPILRPPLVVAIGLNYREHAAEQAKSAPDAPMLFCKAPAAVIGPGEPIRLPPQASRHVDTEVELAVVIGRGGEAIPRDRALDHVFGFTIANDVSARDAQKKDKQFFRAKSFKTFCPLGPVVVPQDEIAFDDLALASRWNGEPMQRGRTSDLVFDVPFLVEYVSSIFPLEPGLVIATGTPSGVGVFRDPPVFLKPGDVVECEIEGIGILRNPVVATG
jgi:2-keto-4-pentenoate hydratase/2-oxohepta-3-ene-1,7-dioic acid hydratase in catechol pathway